MVISTQYISYNRYMEDIEKCIFFLRGVCKCRMWTEMENANVEKLCRYFSDKKVHQDLTCFSVTHLYLLISNIQPFFSFSVLVSSSWGYWIRKSTIICCIKSFNLFGCHVVDEFLKKMSCLFTFLWIYLPLHLYLWPSTFAFTALKPNRVHSKQHFVPCLVKFLTFALHKL